MSTSFPQAPGSAQHPPNGAWHVACDPGHHVLAGWGLEFGLYELHLVPLGAKGSASGRSPGRPEQSRSD